MPTLIRTTGGLLKRFERMHGLFLGPSIFWHVSSLHSRMDELLRPGLGNGIANISMRSFPCSIERPLYLEK